MLNLSLLPLLALCSVLSAQNVILDVPDHPCGDVTVDVQVDSQDFLEFRVDNGLPMNDPLYEYELVIVWDLDGDGEDTIEIWIPSSWSKMRFWDPENNLDSLTGDTEVTTGC